MNHMVYLFLLSILYGDCWIRILWSYKLSSDDVFITSGCTQAIDVALTMLARPGANILLPRPGFPIYELCAAFRSLEVRHVDLLPEKGFEADLDAIAALADQNSKVLCKICIFLFHVDLLINVIVTEFLLYYTF